MDMYNANDHLRSIIDLIDSGYFSHGDTSLFKPLVDELKYDDAYMLLADFQSYIDCQQQVDTAYADKEQWLKKSICTVSRMANFSSDRAIREYCRRIWQVKPVEVILSSG